MSVNIKIRDAVKKYGQNTVISGLSMDIREGELFTLLGPSGCGKTTLLRMIAGFNSIEGGDFYFGDTRINDMDPGKRNIGMVFQNYAIFPHLSVKDNVAFGLKNRKYPKEKIEQDTDEFLKLMQITEYKDRMPEKLSGGQQQRVALARALVIKPEVLLMDEPLSNLDAKLRVEMRSVIKDIQKEVNITTIYVTHDQEEAMAISDRIAVMKNGIIQQVGTPRSLYQRPSNLFVATFIGRSNVIDGQLSIHDGKTILKLTDKYQVELNTVKADIKNDQKVKVSIRPEELVINTEDDEGLDAIIDSNMFLGLNTHYFVHLIENNEKVEIIQESSIDGILAPNTQIKLTVKRQKINVFDEEGNSNLMVGVSDEK